MRRFEFLLLFAAAFAVYWPVVFGVRPRRGLVALGLSAALFTQLQFEGFRWQMIPLYLVAVGLAFGDVIYLERKFEWSGRIVRALLGTVGLVATSVVPVVLPVPEIPTPAGPEAIGTMTIAMIDRERDEPFGERPGGPREFMVQVWYPAREREDRTRIPWSEDWEVVIPAISRNMGLPSWFWSHTRYSLSHADQEGPVADGTYPVIIYSHGWDGVRTNSLNQIEHLVSNGYIVIAPDHTHVAAATVLEDGDVAPQDKDALPDPTGDEEAYDEAVTLMVETQTGDLINILNGLDQGEEGPFGEIAARADLNRIGVYGHGTGGGAAIKICLDEEDERCKAVLAMDPSVSGLTERDLQQEMTRPALYMRSEDWVGSEDDALLSGIAARAEAVTYSIGIRGATSNDFVMVPLLTPLASQFDWRGDIPAGRVITIIDNYLLGFFDVFLLGTGPAQLDSVSFSEVDVFVFEPREP